MMKKVLLEMAWFGCNLTLPLMELGKDSPPRALTVEEWSLKKVQHVAWMLFQTRHGLALWKFLKIFGKMPKMRFLRNE